MTKELFDETLWEQVWREDPNTAVKKMKRSGVDPTRAFDEKAAVFNEQSFNEEGKRRSRRIMNWIEGQGVNFEGASILDIGAASGVFSIPFAERGAHVTSVEPNEPLARLFNENRQKLSGPGSIELVTDAFEDIDIEARGWKQAFDLVFVSMCPVVSDWLSVEKVLSCAKGFCYISTMAGGRENSLLSEVWPLVSDRPYGSTHLEFGYLQHLLYLKGYSYESLVSRELKTTIQTREEALKELMNWLRMADTQDAERKREIIAEHLARRYPDDRVVAHEGGRFGKVLVRLGDQRMFSRE
ncbi:class I SAM-dependent methyltransferase [Paenibacillus ferrarius]|uniref:class I SAM-dependent methyltransferase n=1 Tax=Paenibacillus ferrarius TaxID=1469647 RepID=UPI003D289BDF